MKNKIILIISLYLAFNTNAYAYLDPGSGSIIIQIIAAIAGSFFIFFNHIKAQIKQLFKKKVIKKNNKKNVKEK